MTETLMEHACETPTHELVAMFLQALLDPGVALRTEAPLASSNWGEKVKAAVAEALSSRAPQAGCCGFCGKFAHEVARLIDGPITSICNECIDLLRDMLEPTPTDAPKGDVRGALERIIDSYVQQHGETPFVVTIRAALPMLSTPIPDGRAPEGWRDLLHAVVDLTWGRALEDGSVPSTKIADDLIDTALGRPTAAIVDGANLLRDLYGRKFAASPSRPQDEGAMPSAEGHAWYQNCLRLRAEVARKDAALRGALVIIETVGWPEAASDGVRAAFDERHEAIKAALRPLPQPPAQGGE